jgi:hypothetical protein
VACAKSLVRDYPTLKILHLTGLALTFMGLSGILAMEMTGFWSKFWHPALKNTRKPRQAILGLQRI